MIHRSTLLMMHPPRRRRPMGCIRYGLLALLTMLGCGYGVHLLIQILGGYNP